MTESCADRPSYARKRLEYTALAAELKSCAFPGIRAKFLFQTAPSAEPVGSRPPVCPISLT